MSVLAPAEMDAKEHSPSSTGAEQLSPSPSPTVTVPAGVPAPGASTVTVQAMVYVSPVTEGSLSSLVMVVVVAALLTVWTVAGALADVRKLESPA